jgi:alpha(1,3/1,4) fucosyltransferase
MLRKWFLFSSFFWIINTISADRVEVISNIFSDIQYYNQILQKQQIDATAVSMTVDQYGKGFKKNRTILGNLLRKLSLDFPKSIQLHPDLRKIIFMNIPEHFYRDYHVAKLPKEKVVLFMWEPHLRMRKMYYPKLHQYFSRVYTWDDDLVDNQHYFKFYYPVHRWMISEVVPYEEKKFCTMVSGYVPDLRKYLQKYPEELYSQRMKAIDFFEKIGESGFEFYGRGWEKTSYQSYRGPCNDKVSVIKNYRFSICYENCRDVPGYITEKIFDCFAAGNVPIYWGANNITDYIPKDCFIDRRDFATLDDLYVFLKTMSKEDYEGYLDRIREYLQSEQAQLFSQENFYKIFAEAVGH